MDKRHIIEARGISYSYGSGRNLTAALKGIDLTVDSGEIFGFLGPNGAGKTTTIKILLGILKPTDGDVRIFGGDPMRAGSRFKIGYMPETADYYKYLTPFELMTMYSRFFGIDKGTAAESIPYILDMVGLEGQHKKIMKTFSKGMMQKVSFAQALINDPDLLILDEPMGGLDPLARNRMRTVINDLRDKGKTIFFSSHELSEVELVSDRIVILKKGRIVVSGEVSGILGSRKEGQSLESFFLKIIGER